MRKKKPVLVHGWVVLDKPLGLTSTQALGRVRRLVGGSKAGHGGTLDPLATGVLPLAFGEATKLIPYVMDGDKEYLFTITWGEDRTTLDSEGSVTAISDVRPDAAAIEAVLPAFVGVIAQIPPAFSAIKIDGQRAYDLARAGETLELVARPVRIDTLVLLKTRENSADFRVSCGKGTYVRSLARDISEKLGTCGYISALRRTKSGAFTLEKSISLPDLEKIAAQNPASLPVSPIESAVSGIKNLILSDSEAQKLRLGQKILIKPHHGAEFSQKIAFATHNNIPVALIEPLNGEWCVVRGFHF